MAVGNDSVCSLNNARASRPNLMKKTAANLSEVITEKRMPSGFQKRNSDYSD